MSLPGAERVDYRLTYAAEDEPRRLHAEGIEGARIPDAYDRHTLSNGDWLTGRCQQSTDPAENILYWFKAAVAEAVHESLEWYRVDGRPLLDPHGEWETQIHSHVAVLADALSGLAKGSL